MMRRLILTLMVFGLVACGPPPRPFQHGSSPETDNPLLMMESGLGLMVAPTKGASTGMGEMLTEAMSQALQAADIPTVPWSPSLRAAKAHTIVHAVLAEEPASEDTLFITVTWTLKKPDGEEIGRKEITEELDTRSWSRGSPADVGRLLGNVPAYFGLILNEDPGPEAAPPAPPVVRIEPVTGAPGNGNPELTGAMAGILRGGGLEMAIESPNAPPPDFTVTGVVAITPIDAQTDDLSIRWRVKDANGKDLGAVDLGNPVSRSLIKGTWGTLAIEIARGGADGIMQILNRNPPKEK